MMATSGRPVAESYVNHIWEVPSDFLHCKKGTAEPPHKSVHPTNSIFCWFYENIQCTWLYISTFETTHCDIHIDQNSIMFKDCCTKIWNSSNIHLPFISQHIAPSASPVLTRSPPWQRPWTSAAPSPSRRCEQQPPLASPVLSWENHWNWRVFQAMELSTKGPTGKWAPVGLCLFLHIILIVVLHGWMVPTNYPAQSNRFSLPVSRTFVNICQLPAGGPWSFYATGWLRPIEKYGRDLGASPKNPEQKTQQTTAGFRDSRWATTVQAGRHVWHGLHPVKEKRNIAE